MKIEVAAQYTGPNIHVPAPAIRLRLRAEYLKGWHAAVPPVRFFAPLFAVFPDLQQRITRAISDAGGRLSTDATDGETLAAGIAHAAIELQRLANDDVDAANMVPTGTPGSYEIVIEYRDYPVAMLAAKMAAPLVVHLLSPGQPQRFGLHRDYNAASARESFLTEFPRHCLDLTTSAIVRVAEARGIPWFRLENGRNLVQVGHGRFARRLLENVWDDEGLIPAGIISSDKVLTNRLLQSVGLPTTQQHTVSDTETAKRSAAVLGFPVVVKPRHGSKGADVYVGLDDEAAVEQAVREIQKGGDGAIVERFVPGDDYRLLVVGGRLIAAAQRIPASVVGDGQHTIDELVEITNANPRRGNGFDQVLTRLTLDETAIATLASAGHTKDSVPGDGERVFLRRNANMSTGGTGVDVTDQVHPDNRRLAELAARAVGLQVAGVDYITRDITKPYRETGGAICEVNKSPGLTPHWADESEKYRDFVSPILDLKFPPGEDHHVPVAALSGQDRPAETAQMLAYIVEQAGICVGLASSAGVTVDGWQLAEGDFANPGGFHMAARNPLTELVVAEITDKHLIEQGLGFTHCDVAAVTGTDVDRLSDTAAIKRIVADTVSGTLVLNADDSSCLTLLDAAVADFVCLVTTTHDNTAVQKHTQAGGRAVRLSDSSGSGTPELDDGGRRTSLMDAAGFSAIREGTGKDTVKTVLFAAALAWGLGIEIEHIRNGLAGYR